MLDLQVVDLFLARMIDKDFLQDLCTVENIVFKTCRQFRITLSVNWHMFLLRKSFAQIWKDLVLRFSLQHVLKTWYAYSGSRNAEYVKSLVGLRFDDEVSLSCSGFAEFYWHFYSKRTIYSQIRKRKQHRLPQIRNVIEALENNDFGEDLLAAPESAFVRTCIANAETERYEQLVMFQISADQFYGIKKFMKQQSVEDVQIGLASTNRHGYSQNSISIGYSYARRTLKRSFDEISHLIDCKSPASICIGLPVENLVYFSGKRPFTEVFCKNSFFSAALDAIEESQHLQIFQVLFKMKDENAVSISIGGFARESFFCNILTEIC